MSERETLLAALKALYAVRSTALRCWCDNSFQVVAGQHQGKCQAATNAVVMIERYLEAQGSPAISTDQYCSFCPSLDGGPAVCTDDGAHSICTRCLVKYAKVMGVRLSEPAIPTEPEKEEDLSRIDSTRLIPTPDATAGMD